MHRRDLLKATTATLAGAAMPATSMSAATAHAARPGARRSGASTPFIETPDGTHLYCRSWGDGPPVVFLSGWGLAADFWSYVMAPLSASGRRCIAFDRRGHGRSTDPGGGYDYDTLADDLAAVINALDLKDVTLVAHSMSGGEAVRYLGRHGSARVARVALVATTLPFLAKADDNPDGIEPGVLDQMRAVIAKDFPKWLTDSMRPFFVPETSQSLMEWGVRLMTETSLQAIIECHRSMTTTDFRPELRKLALPTLVIHGDKDASAPLAITGAKAAELLKNVSTKIYAGGPHGLPLTHAAQLAGDLLTFTRR